MNPAEPVTNIFMVFELFTGLTIFGFYFSFFGMIPAGRFGLPEGCHTAYERIPPVGDVDSECRFDFGLVEYQMCIRDRL